MKTQQVYTFWLSVICFLPWAAFAQGDKKTTLSQSQKTALQWIEDNMLKIKGGSFSMGENLTDLEKIELDNFFSGPIHTATLSDFYLCRFEVTQAVWEALMGENPSKFQDCPDCPVENISWEDCKLFLQRLNQLSGKNYSLPTEAQWEYAALGGAKTTRITTYAGSDLLHEVGWYEENSENRTHPVGEKAPNALGLYDMTGNVWEWCEDWFLETFYALPEATELDPVNDDMPSEYPHKVLRGGSWANGTSYTRIKNRGMGVIDFPYEMMGLRLARMP
ncbi:MAG TPA: hypothetical protein DCM08_13985 [Microscillaceae bacterium]|nr:hypothetical protein [Microscillaceae bacterium]